VALQQEQADQDSHGQGNDVRRKQGGNDANPLYGTQYRDGRGNHPVAIKQAGGKQTHQHKNPATGSMASGTGFNPNPPAKK